MIAYNDLVALGVQAGIADLGMRCPDDMSIVGIDDIEIGSAVQPALTTVHLAIERAGALAVELLLERIGGSTDATIYHLESQLIVRGSTARPRALIRLTARSAPFGEAPDLPLVDVRHPFPALLGR